MLKAWGNVELLSTGRALLDPDPQQVALLGGHRSQHAEHEALARGGGFVWRAGSLHLQCVEGRAVIRVKPRQPLWIPSCAE